MSKKWNVIHDCDGISFIRLYDLYRTRYRKESSRRVYKK